MRRAKLREWIRAVDPVPTQDDDPAGVAQTQECRSASDELGVGRLGRTR